MRLIDADALISDLEHDVKRDTAVLDTLALDRISRENIQFDKDWKQNAVDLLMRAPTIDPEPHWIPCTERLPEIWDYVFCSQINGDVGEGKLLDDECWHICYDQSHRRKSWVVAWQPLPESYKEEGGEE